MPDYAALAMDFTNTVRDILKDAYPLLFERAYGDASATIGVDVSFTLDNPFVQQVLGELLTASSLDDLGANLIDTARALIGRQADEGWSVDELAAQLIAAGVTDSVDRAEKIAHTETARAYSMGSILAYKESGVVKGMTWLVTDPCPICDALNGKVARLDEDFAPGIRVPGDTHPRCRCAIAPVLKD